MEAEVENALNLIEFHRRLFKTKQDRARQFKCSPVVSLNLSIKISIQRATFFFSAVAFAVSDFHEPAY